MKSKLVCGRNLSIIVFLLSLFGFNAHAQWDFKSNYFKIHVDNKGFITSMKNTTVTPNREFSPTDKPSPLMCLYNSSKKKYYEPQQAKFDNKTNTFTLNYSNGSVAKVVLSPKAKYLKLTLQSLSKRENIDDIQWGSYHTNITNLFGEVIGVARDTTKVVNYAIGAMALNDQTTGGISNTEGEAAPFQYMIHSPDPKLFPLPADLHEGQIFSIGGDGKNDVAFYSHPEEYYRILYGNSALIDEKGRVYITYHSLDRTKRREIFFSLIPMKETNIPNHIDVPAIPKVDYIGSSIALWGSPDNIALMDVLQNIVLSEKLPHPTVNGKWIKDPSRYIPDVTTSGNLFDSIPSYTKQLGFKAIHVNDFPYYRPNRGVKGYIDGKEFEKKPFKFTSGNKSHKEFSELCIPLGITFGRHTVCTALPQGSKDASPIPSDSLCYQQRRLLAKNISPTDTIIQVNDPKHLEEIGSWEGHSKSLNMIKIGKELIHYLGVTTTYPYTLKKVKRGYWGTTATDHKVNDTIYKMQVTINAGYDGLIPNIDLQDKIAEDYADVAKINGMYFMDLDGQEFLFNTGQGYYGVKRFFSKMFDRAASYKIPDLRITGATLSEGSWHYQSVWNVGGGKNMYDVEKRVWGSTTSEGKDLRDVAFANFFPATFGGNFSINKNSKVEDYEHVQAISVGVGATYMLGLNQKSVESSPQKYQIFKAIRTWEDARAANAFPDDLKRKLADPKRSWTLEKGKDNNTWILYEKINGAKTNPTTLTRAKGY
ncbi:hypothetical protein [Flavobacterium gilvum]|uniref:Uncharacterized protein n=1 Tax=Flavobacterium gilvum TaxID=1492737 RepID=A0AAC9I6J9_9FLAO|nr:hypothetical protein [Flavobacterium gilvum]AOW10552.1 hypothetical protein EM308_14180 [Flavobacterium gilvum]KFC59579.1 hypothetical protein FEM08_16280 [Flavobacterium gilvum]